MSSNSSSAAQAIKELEIQITFGERGMSKLIYNFIDNMGTTCLADPVEELASTHINKLRILVKFLKNAEKEEIVLSKILSVLDALRISPENVEFLGCNPKVVRGILQVLSKIPTDFTMRCPAWQYYFDSPFETTARDAEEATFVTYEEVKKYSRVELIAAQLPTVHTLIQDIISDSSLTPMRTMEIRFLRNDLGSVLESLGGLSSAIQMNIPTMDIDLFRMHFIEKNVKKSIDTVHLIVFDSKWILMAEAKGKHIYIVCCEKKPVLLLKALVEIVFDPKKINVDTSKYMEEFTAAKNINEQGEVFGRLCTNVNKERTKK